MKTIKFINKDNSKFASVLRKKVSDHFKEKDISSKGNFKMVLKALVMIAIYFLPFISILFLPLPGWTIFPLAVVMGIGMSGIGMCVMHDAVHGSFSERRWVNRLFGFTMYLIGGNILTWKIQHNILHHTYTNIEGYDEDIEPKGSLRLSKHTPLKKIHRFQHIYAFFFYCLMSLSRTFRDMSQLNKYNKTGLTKKHGFVPQKEMIRLIMSKTAYFAVFLGLPLLFSSFSWGLILLGFLVMHCTAGLLMSTIFQMAHVVEKAQQPLSKEGVIENEWMLHELETTVNFSGKSRFFSWLIGGLNFQIEHHLFPNICHIHYAAISPLVKGTAEDFGLTYKENITFLNALGSHIRVLRALGKPPLAE